MPVELPAPPARRTHTLAGRVVLLTMLAIGVLVPIFGVVGFRIARGVAMKQILRAQNNATAAAMASIEQRIGEAGDEVRIMAENGATELWLKKPAPQRDASAYSWQQLQIHEMAEHSGPWESLWIVDPAGRIVLSDDGRHVGESILIESGTRDVFLKTLSGRDNHSDLTGAPDSGAPALFFAAPIRSNSRDAILGVAVGRFELSSLNQFLDQVAAPNVPYLVDAHGLVIAAQSRMASQIFRTRLDPIEEPSQALRTSRHESRTGDGWQMIFDIPKESVYAPLRELERGLALWTIAFFGALVAIGYFLTRHFVRPIVQMTGLADRIEGGNLEWDVDIRTGDEIERLADSFKGMVTRLRIQIGERERSEERFRLAALATKDVIFDSELSSDLCWVNEAWQTRYGYSHSGTIALSEWTGAIHPDDRAATAADLKAAFESGQETWNREYRFQRADGTFADVVTHAYIARDPSGAPRHIAGAMTEITEQKAAAAALRKSEERFALATRATDDVIFDLDLRTNACWVNESWSSHYGYPRSGDIKFANWSESIHPDDSGRILGNVNSALASEETRWLGEYKFRLGNGTYADVLTRAYIVRGESGEALRMVGAMSDVSESKRAHARLRSAQAFLRSTIDNIPEIIAVKAVSDSRYMMANRTALGLGYPVLGQTDADIFSREEAAVMRAEDAAVIESRRGSTATTRSYSVGEEMRWFRTSRMPLLDAGGAVEFILVVAEDVTAQIEQQDMRRQKESAEAATAAKGAFLARMSHEIRTPMNGVLGMASLLADTPLTAEQKEFADTIQSSATALLVVINDILDLSKIESGKMTLDRSPFALRRMVSDSAKVLAVAAAQKGVELVVDIDPEVPDGLIGDGPRVRQMILNLAGNAVKFTNRGEVVISRCWNLA